MKLKFKSFSLLILIFVSIHSFGQSNWQNGFYVTGSSDTVHGFINHKEWTRNPSSFSFKKALDQKDERTLGLNEVRYFEITDLTSFTRSFVSISMNEIQLSASGSQHPSRNDTVFLKLVQAGSVAALYSYKDDLKERYYLQSAGDPSPQELIYSVESSADGIARVVEKYKGQLYTAAAKAGKLNADMEWRIKRTSYGSQSLTDIVNRINGAEGVKKKPSAGKPNVVKSGLNFYFGIGASRSDLIYSGGPEWTKSSSPSYNACAAIGVTYFTNPSVRRFFLRSEVSIGSASFHTVANNSQYTYAAKIDYTFNQLNTGILLSFNYNFYNAPRVKYFVGAGVSARFCSYSNNTYTFTETFPSTTSAPNYRSITEPDYFSLTSKYYTVPVRIGMVFNNRVEGYVEYATAYQVNEYYALWLERIVSTRLGLNYWIHAKR